MAFFDWVFPKFSKRPVRRKSAPCVRYPRVEEIPEHLEDATEAEVIAAIKSVPRHQAALNMYFRSDTPAVSAGRTLPNAWFGSYTGTANLASVQFDWNSAAGTAQQTNTQATGITLAAGAAVQGSFAFAQYITSELLSTTTIPSSSAYIIGNAFQLASLTNNKRQVSVRIALYRARKSDGTLVSTVKTFAPAGIVGSNTSEITNWSNGLGTTSSFTIGGDNYLVAELFINFTNTDTVNNWAIGNASVFDCGTTAITSNNAATSDAKSFLQFPTTILGTFPGEEEDDVYTPIEDRLASGTIYFLPQAILQGNNSGDDDGVVLLPPGEEEPATSLNVLVTTPQAVPRLALELEESLSSWFIDDDQAPSVNKTVGVPSVPPYVSTEQDDSVSSQVIDDDRAPSVNVAVGTPWTPPWVSTENEEAISEVSIQEEDRYDPTTIVVQPWNPLVLRDEDPWRLTRGLEDERDIRNPVTAMTITWAPVVIAEPHETYSQNIFDDEQPANPQVVAQAWTPLVFADTDENGGLVAVALDDDGYSPTTVYMTWTPVVFVDDETTYLAPLDDEQYAPTVVAQMWTPYVAVDVDELQPTAVAPLEDDNTWTPVLLAQPWNNAVTIDNEEAQPSFVFPVQEDDPTGLPQRTTFVWTPYVVTDDEVGPTAVVAVEEESVPAPQVTVGTWTPVVIYDNEDAWVPSNVSSTAGVYIITVCRGPSRWRTQNFADDLQLEQVISGAFREDDVAVVLPEQPNVWNAPPVRWDEEQYPPPQPLTPDDEANPTRQTVLQYRPPTLVVDFDADYPLHPATPVEPEQAAPTAVMTSVWTPVVYAREEELIPTAALFVDDEQGYAKQRVQVTWTPVVVTYDETTTPLISVPDEVPGWEAQTQAVYWCGYVYRDEDAAPQLRFVDDEFQAKYPTVTVTWRPVVARDDDLVTLLPQDDDQPPPPRKVTVTWNPVVVSDEFLGVQLVRFGLDQQDDWNRQRQQITWTPRVFTDDEAKGAPFAAFSVEEDLLWLPKLLVSVWRPVVWIDDEANGGLKFIQEQEDGWVPRYLVVPWYPYVFTDDELNYAKSLNVTKMADVYANVQVVSGVAGSAAVADVYVNTVTITGQVGGG